MAIATIEVKRETQIKEARVKKKIENLLNDLSASEWIAETVSVFVQKGLGANHQEAQIEKQHPAPFSYLDVSRLIKFFTKKNQKVLDPFCGVASTLKACALLEREAYGIELSKKYYDLAMKRLKTELNGSFNPLKHKLIYGDALKAISTFKENYFDFIITSPPYWNILNKINHKAKQERIANGLDTKYGNSSKDLGNIPSYDVFLETLTRFFEDCSRVLRPKKYICVIVSDFRHKDKYYLFHSDLAARMTRNHYYALKGVTVLYQKFKRVFPYGYPYSYVPNIHHQYILIFQNHAK